MARTRRVVLPGETYHVLNRGVRRTTLFHDPEEYEHFVRFAAMALRRTAVDLFAYCLMPNHWHFVVRPREDRALAKFLHLLCTTHARAFQDTHQAAGLGHLYQSRYRCFAVETERYLLSVLRYVEANPRRARLVKDARKWRWSSLGQSEQSPLFAALAPWPVDRPAHWPSIVNSGEFPDLDAIRTATTAGPNSSLGCVAWQRELSIRQCLSAAGDPTPDPTPPVGGGRGTVP